MKIEYKILWVEDNKSWYKTTSELFTDYLDELGFKLNCQRCDGIDEVNKELKNNGLVSYDLLLVDYTLKGTASGDDVINAIRNFGDHQILTEVLFYSSAIENVRDSMRKHSLEGVYTADRKDIETKFEQVVNTTIKKVQDVNAMRGLIMAETSELDNLMLSIVMECHNKKDDNSKELKIYIIEKITEFNTNNTGKLDELLVKDDLLEIVNSSLFHSMLKAKSIQKLAGLINDPRLNELKSFTKDYTRDVISIRNNFAHVVERIDKSTGLNKLVSHLDGKEIEFTSEKCALIRKDLIKYSEKLQELKKIIQ